MVFLSVETQRLGERCFCNVDDIGDLATAFTWEIKDPIIPVEVRGRAAVKIECDLAAERMHQSGQLGKRDAVGMALSAVDDDEHIMSGFDTADRSTRVLLA